MEREDVSTVRHLYSFDVSRRGATLAIDVVANAFLPHQVRRMVGALAEVGKGKLGAEEYAALLQGPPGSGGPAAPPHGLYLERVTYGDDPFGLEGLDSESRLC
jgi:tRNA pseudouridine38-40 synthase